MQRLLWLIVDIHASLWDEKGHTLRQLQVLDDAIISMLDLFKETFGHLSKSECRFLKFHMSLHLTYVATEFGSLRTVDLAFGESAHKGVKSVYRMTNRKVREGGRHMYNATASKEVALLRRAAAQPGTAYSGV